MIDQNQWKQSFDSLNDAITRLEEVISFPLDEHRVVIDATIQRFEFTFELFWKNLKRLLFVEGIQANTPREVLKMAFHLKLIHEEDTWLSMLKDRNEASHVYNEDKANEIYEHIVKYAPLLRKTYDSLFHN